MPREDGPPETKAAFIRRYLEAHPGAACDDVIAAFAAGRPGETVSKSTVINVKVQMTMEDRQKARQERIEAIIEDDDDAEEEGGREDAVDFEALEAEADALRARLMSAAEWRPELDEAADLIRRASRIIIRAAPE